jgi:hypothetical protein
MCWLLSKPLRIAIGGGVALLEGCAKQAQIGASLRVCAPVSWELDHPGAAPTPPGGGKAGWSAGRHTHAPPWYHNRYSLCRDCGVELSERARFEVPTRVSAAVLWELDHPEADPGRAGTGRTWRRRTRGGLDDLR